MAGEGGMETAAMRKNKRKQCGSGWGAGCGVGGAGWRGVRDELHVDASQWRGWGMPARSGWEMVVKMLVKVN